MEDHIARSSNALLQLEAGMIIPFGGDRFSTVGSRLAADFQVGDALVVSQSDGELLHIKQDVRRLVADRIGEASKAFLALRKTAAADRASFFDAFATHLEDDEIWRRISLANDEDVSRAKSRGRDVGRLALRQGSREAMVEGLRHWQTATSQPDEPIAEIDHVSWSIEARRAPVGVMGFVFEGRPNVLIDGCGVVASGNTAVMRIGEDAEQTADAIMKLALEPALDLAKLPRGVISVLPSALGRESAWAMFTDRRIALAVARGSGPAVKRLGDLAAQSGIPVSLHGEGGAWLLADDSASIARFAMVVAASLDRKVCNTLNTCLIVRSRASDLVPALIAGLMSAARPVRRAGRLHVLAGSESHVPSGFFDLDVPVDRGGDEAMEKFATVIPRHRLDKEWEWQDTPEISLAIVDDLAEGVDLINRYSPRFVASLIAEDQAAQDAFYETVDAPFVGDGFSRWVDGQYALGKPELGLANWQFGRPIGRSSILAGDGVHTVRLRMRQVDPELRR